MQDRDEGGQMAAIAQSIEISRRPEDVFSYATDYSHFPQWQRRVVSARQEGNAPVAVGTRAAVTRRVGLRQLLTTEEITGLDPPRTWQVRGANRRAVEPDRTEPADQAAGSVAVPPQPPIRSMIHPESGWDRAD
jgi:Polyketide cyclase / dehydrase and lipid transport